MQLPTMESFLIDSAEVGDQIEVTIALPAGASRDGEPLRAVYVLDPSFNFLTVTAAANWLSTASGLAGEPVPPMIVVGVGYPTDDLGGIMARRARDLTPTAGDASPIPLPSVPFGFGGAAHFLDALVHEVIPEVEARSLADHRDRTLFGHSFGGLFALYTLFRRPDAFQRYLVVSPSIWWDDRVVLRDEQAWADSHTDLEAKVFWAVGRQEQEPGGGWKNEGFPDEIIAAVQQVDNVTAWAHRLQAKGYSNLDLDGLVLEGEYHLTVSAAAATRGLRTLFAGGPQAGESKIR
jgi:predicted alpha/beta superfamily hydrolase